MLDKHTQMLNRIKELEAENRNLKKRKRYGLIWEDAPEELDNPDIIPLLREVKEKRIVKNPDGDNNYLIEGDNYHALKALQHTHRGKIDVIYIDPPYNTGNEFVYNDKIVDKEDSFRHSKWLSFMSKRLELARKLLSDEGVIFVSIDDNEQAQLKLLMDSIFGENNFVGNQIQLKGNTQNNADNMQKNHEYILTYLKNNTKTNVLNERITQTEQVSTQRGYDVFNSTVKYYRNKTRLEKGGYVGGKLVDRKNLGYSIYVNTKNKKFKAVHDYDTNKVKLGIDYCELYEDDKDLVSKGYNIIIRPSKVNGEIGRWRWSIETFNERIDDVRIDLKNNKAYIIEKLYDEDVEDINNKNVIVREINNPLKSVINFPTKNGSDMFNQLGIKHNFNYPKNLDMMKYLIKSYHKKDICVMDFFAGSGTTGHAVMELNKEDGGKRKFILCTNNEVNEEKVREYFTHKGLLSPNTKTVYNKFKEENKGLVEEFKLSDEYKELGIARSVTYERNRKVIEGYTTPKGVEIDGLPNNLVYLETVEYRHRDVNLPFTRTDMYVDVQTLHELAYPSTEYDNYYISVNDEINIEPKGKPITVLLDGNTEENNVIIDYLRLQGYSEIIYRTFEHYI